MSILLGMRDDPKSSNSKIIIEPFIVGVERPTTIEFIDEHLLVLEKNSGKIKLYKDGVLQNDSLIDFEVSNAYEQGLLGIKSFDESVFIYLTQANEDGFNATSNSVLKFDWDGDELKNQQTLLTLPSFGLGHIGGALEIDKNGDLFVVVGDQRGTFNPVPPGPLQNSVEGRIDDTGIILKIDPTDIPLMLNDEHYPISNYYAIGIRNSFGLTIDPITENLWDTENGPENFDEINLVSSKFNSGWNKVMGPANSTQLSQIPAFEDFVYDDPKFSWESTVVPTKLLFITDSKWPTEIQNSVLVGTCSQGNIYKFLLNQERTHFLFNSSDLSDLVSNDGDDSEEIIFLSGMGCVTDMELGPDGSLYVVSHTNNGIIYKITSE